MTTHPRMVHVPSFLLTYPGRPRTSFVPTYRSSVKEERFLPDESESISKGTGRGVRSPRPPFVWVGDRGPDLHCRDSILWIRLVPYRKGPGSLTKSLPTHWVGSGYSMLPYEQLTKTSTPGLDDVGRTVVGLFPRFSTSCV